jgi:hypothetical protein
MQQMIFIADLIACSTCFGHHYAYHQELDSIIQKVAACGILFSSCQYGVSGLWDAANEGMTCFQLKLRFKEDPRGLPKQELKIFYGTPLKCECSSAKTFSNS